MKQSKYIVRIWFLSEDLRQSAQYLANSYLDSTIKSTVNALLAAYFYLVGIRSKGMHKIMFSDEHADETMALYFKSWPFKSKPGFQLYNSVESRWCRRCHENFNYLKEYLSLLLDEYNSRHGKPHKQDKFYDWIEYAILDVDFPFAGIDRIDLPAKHINPNFRKSADVIKNYQLQYVKSFKHDNAFAEYEDYPHDIPSFVLEMTNANGVFGA